MQTQSSIQKKKHKRRISMRLIIFIIASVSLVIGTVLWIADGNAGGGRWATIVSVLFVAVGLFISLLQWLFPVSTDTVAETRVPPLVATDVTVAPTVATLAVRSADEHYVIHEKNAYRGILGLPPPTDARTIQQRTRIVREIYAQFTTSAVTALVLTGIGGVGKSTIAALVATYAEEQSRISHGPFTAEPLWLTIDKHVTMVDLVGTLFHTLGKPLLDVEKLSPQNQARALFHALNEMSETRLIVLDQFENFLDWQTGQVLLDRPGIGEFVDAMNSRLCHSKLLLTSRLRPLGTRVYPPTFMHTYPITGLDSIEGVELLRKQGIEPGIATDEELRTVVMQCGGHALAMTLFASLLRRNRSTKLPELLEAATYTRFWRGDVARNLLDHIYTQQLGPLHRQLLQSFAIYRQAVPLEAALALLDIENTRAWRDSIFALDGLLAQHLLQTSDGAYYQSHTIITDYIKEQLSDERNSDEPVQLFTAHAKAARYYLQMASRSYPARNARKYMRDVQPFIEAVWHLCQAERWPEAYQVIEQENLYDDLRRWGGNTTLLELYQLLLPLHRWYPEPAREAAIYSRLGRISSTLGLKEQTMHYYTDALRLYRAMGDRHGEAGALNHLGTLHENLGLYTQAMSYHQQALHLYREIGDRKGESNSLNGLAWIYYHLGRREEALDYYKRALSIRQEIGHRLGVSDSLDGLSLVYHVLGKQDLALKYTEQSLLIRRAMGDHAGEGRTLNHLGLIYTSIGQTDRAYSYYKTSLAIRREVGDRNGEGVMFYNIGKLYLQDQHYKASLACFLSAQNIFEEIQSTQQDATKRWLAIVQQQVGKAQFTLLLTEVEPQISHITEQALLSAL